MKQIKIIKNRSDIGAGTRGSDMGIDAIEIAATKTSVSKNEWIKNGKIIDMIRQKTLLDYF